MSSEKHIRRSLLLLLQSMEIVCNKSKSTNTNREIEKTCAQKMMMMMKKKTKRKQKCTSKNFEWKKWMKKELNVYMLEKKVELQKNYYSKRKNKRRKKTRTQKWSSMSMMVVNKIYFNLGTKSQIKDEQRTYNILIVLCNRCKNKKWRMYESMYER